ncbi:HdeD family acid-resistance protein [Pseudaestuariivita sp.]|uniref:HdeD family acid-resistance protein n=1 Tax=Pseudaestuariivita sp. TaxID=2211669 RepID=UPI00405948B4
MMIISGIVLLIGGIFALILPLLASLTATLIVGWTLILSGAFHFVEAYRQSEQRWWNIGFGLLLVLAGASFLFNPLSGMLSLTIVLGAVFFASGLMQLYLAWARRRTDMVWLLGLSGVLSVGLAVLIALNLFTAAATVPGIVLAIELISTGVALLFMRPDPRKTAENAKTTGEKIPV